MKVRNGGHVPGAAGHGTREESECVVNKVGDDDFDGAQGKFDDRGRGCPRSLGKTVRGTKFPDFCLTPVPNSHGEQLDHCA